MKVFCLAEKDLRLSLASPTTHILFAIFALICAYFFFNLLASFSIHLERFYSLPAAGLSEQPNLNEWVIEPYFRSLAVVMIFFIPLFIMRFASFEYEKSISELFLSLPISAFDLVLSRFLTLALHLTALLFIAFAYPLLLFVLGNPELLPILSGLLGLFVCTLAFASLSLCVSVVAQAPVAAGVVSFFLLLLLYTLDYSAESIGGSVAGILQYLSPMRQLANPFRGILEFQGFVYFLSVAIFGLLVAWVAASHRRAFE